MERKIILFDGVCNLCNRAVQFIIKRDKKKQYAFAPLQGDIGQQLLRDRGIDTQLVDSIILIEPNIAYYTKAAAAFEIGKSFGGGWKLLGLLEWIPPVISNWVYDVIAKNRYRWFGKREVCMVPTSDLKARFLE